MEGDLTHCNNTTPYEGSSTELGSGVCNALHTGYIRDMCAHNVGS